MAQLVRHQIIEFQSVRNDGKRLTAYRDQRRLIPADIVEMVEEAEVLKNFQRLLLTATQEALQPDWPLPGSAHYAFNVRLGGRSLFVGSDGILRHPALTMGSSLVAAFDYLF